MKLRLIGKSENSEYIYFSGTIAACDLKFGRCRQIIEFMKVCEYSRSMLFLDLGPRSFINENENLLFSRTTGSFLTKFCMLAFRFMEMKICKYNVGHMIKMAAMPVYCKNSLKNPLPRNQRNDYKETWYEASGTPSQHSLFKL